MNLNAPPREVPGPRATLFSLSSRGAHYTVSVDHVPEHFVVVDALDERAGIAEVEFSEGFTGELPAWWLPEVAPGAAYLVRAVPGGLTFEPHPDGARALRERSKGVLLDFRDDPDD